MLFLPFLTVYWLIICGVNQRPISKSMFAILITVLSSTCFHYRSAASLILTLTVPGVTRVAIGIRQKRVRPFNDLVLLVFERPLVTGVGGGGGEASTWSFRSRPSLIETFLQSLFLPSVTSKLFGYIRSCNVRLLLFICCFGFDWWRIRTYNSQDFIALNPGFMMFSSKINARNLILKEFLFVYV